MPETILGLEVHPASEAWRSTMGKKALEELAKDIKKHGMREAIVLCEGKLLDGRNRLRASVIAGIPLDSLPKRELPQGENPYLAVASLNGHRLHLPPRERARNLIKILVAAGEFDKMREESRKRHGRRDLQSSPSGEVLPRLEPVHAQIARAAGVGKMTAQRAMRDVGASKTRRSHTLAPTTPEGRSRRTYKDHTKRVPESWKVPRAPVALAKFLRERWTTGEWRSFMAAANVRDAG